MQDKCFAGDSVVTLKTGAKRMDELKIGDEILSGYERKLPVFVPVTSFPTFQPSAMTEFLRIETSDGTAVKITPLHMIFVTKSNKENGAFDLAKNIAVGDLLVRTNEAKTQFSPLSVTNITIVIEKGAYSPLTSNGTVVVNGLLASCYSVTDVTVQHWLMHWIRSAETYIWQKFQSGTKTDNGEVCSNIVAKNIMCA